MVRLEEVTAEIRPRGEWEAVDLGLALARRDAPRLLASWLVTALPVHILVLGLLRDWLWLAVLVLWWLKPLFARVSLFVLSRGLFGERVRVAQVLREWPRMCWRRWFYRLVVARFSPWRGISSPVEELELLRGEAYSNRCRQLLARGEGTAVALAALGWVLTVVGTLGTLALMVMFVPQEVLDQWMGEVGLWFDADEVGLPVGLQWLLAGVVLWVMAVVEVLFTSASFGLYVNSRTLIEGWDIELSFKRLRDRLSGARAFAAVLVVAALGTFWLAGTARAGGEPDERIKEVLASPDFKVRTVETKVWVPDTKGSPVPRGVSMGGSGFSGIVAMVLGPLGWLVLAVLVGLLVWLVWKFWPRGGRSGAAGRALPRRSVRTVMGMEVGVESLPDDVPAAAWRAWQAGDHQGAMSLLYRGAISALVRIREVPIEESDTESDCLRRVGAMAAAEEGRYFTRLTRHWMSLAYGRRLPGDAEVEALCTQWPFKEGGGR